MRARRRPPSLLASAGHYRTAARAFRLYGYAGPPGRAASEVESKYIITDMYAKAVQGMSAEEAVKWAEGELKKIYV